MLDRTCKKCSAPIPDYIEVEGKRIDLKHRKLCLQCRALRNTSPYKTISKMKNFYMRGIVLKLKLIDMAGGKCIRCGYSKCMSALAFHHRDRGTKVFGITLNALWKRSWDEILIEFKKCDLLCSNCHAEVEEELSRDKAFMEKLKKTMEFFVIIPGTNSLRAA